MSTTLLFSESPSRILLSVKPEDVALVVLTAYEAGVECAEIGRVQGDRLVVKLDNEVLLNEQVAALESKWKTALPVSLDMGM